MELCEQCTRKPQVLYCLTCVKRLCLDCEDYHTPHHSVVTVASGLQCQDHHLPFDIYCETCERLLCATCYQPHASQHHVLAAIQQVFRRKQSLLVSMMTQTAFEKKAAIQAQAARLDKRIRDLRGYKTTIENDVNQCQTLVLDRLHAWVSPFAQRLQREKEDLNRDLEALEGAERVINATDKLQFLGKYRGVTATLEAIATKPITPESEVPFDDLPREVHRLRSNVQDTVLQQALNQARNDTIWDLLRTTPADAQTSDAAVQREVMQWSRLTDKLLQQLADLQFICYICKQKVTGSTVNDPCPMNPMGKVKMEVSRDPMIPPAILGNGYHFVVNAHGDMKKQTERFRLAEQPKTLAQMQQTAVVTSLRTSEGGMPGKRQTGTADVLAETWGFGRQTGNAVDPYRTQTDGYSGYGQREMTRPEPASSLYRPMDSAATPNQSTYRPTYGASTYDKPSESGYRPMDPATSSGLYSQRPADTSAGYKTDTAQPYGSYTRQPESVKILYPVSSPGTYTGYSASAKPFEPVTGSQYGQKAGITSQRPGDIPAGYKTDTAQPLGSYTRQPESVKSLYPASSQGAYTGYSASVKPSEPVTGSQYGQKPDITSQRPGLDPHIPSTSQFPSDISRPALKPESHPRTHIDPTPTPHFQPSQPNPSFTDSFKPTVSASKPQSDFMKTLKTGFSMLETNTHSPVQSIKQEIPTREIPSKGNPMERFTFGGQTGGVAESIRSSINPVDSFGTMQHPEKKPETAKEVHFSYSDSFKSAVELPLPQTRPGSKLQPHQTGLQEGNAGKLMKSQLMGGSWREHVKNVLGSASATFLASCKEFDNGAGEVPLDGLRVALHKSSALLTIDDIDQAAQYIGSGRVNYRSFLSAMTQ